jgi:hypothetical protein
METTQILGNSKYKGPEVRACLVGSRNSQETHMAELEGHEIREEMGRPRRGEFHRHFQLQSQPGGKWLI